MIFLGYLFEGWELFLRPPVDRRIHACLHQFPGELRLLTCLGERERSAPLDGNVDVDNAGDRGAKAKVPPASSVLDSKDPRAGSAWFHKQIEAVAIGMPSRPRVLDFPNRQHFSYPHPFPHLAAVRAGFGW